MLTQVPTIQDIQQYKQAKQKTTETQPSEPSNNAESLRNKIKSGKKDDIVFKSEDKNIKPVNFQIGERTSEDIQKELKELEDSYKEKQEVIDKLKKEAGADWDPSTPKDKALLKGYKIQEDELKKTFKDERDKLNNELLNLQNANNRPSSAVQPASATSALPAYAAISQLKPEEQEEAKKKLGEAKASVDAGLRGEDAQQAQILKHIENGGKFSYADLTREKYWSEDGPSASDVFGELAGFMSKDEAKKWALNHMYGGEHPWNDTAQAALDNSYKLGTTTSEETKILKDVDVGGRTVKSVPEAVKEENRRTGKESIKAAEDYLKEWNKVHSDIVDDKYIENLPKFLHKAYKDGDFGEPGSKDAKSRLGYFIVDSVGTSLRNVGDILKGGKGEEKSEYNKVATENLQKALERRNQKYADMANQDMQMLKVPADNMQEIESALNKVYADKLIGPWLEAQNLRVKQAFVNGLINLSGKYDLKDAAKILITNELLNPGEMKQDATNIISGAVNTGKSLLGL